MNLLRRLRETVDYWTGPDYWTHPESDLDELAVNFYTPKDRRDDVVMVVIAVETHQTDESQMGELRNRIPHIARSGAEAGSGKSD